MATKERILNAAEKLFAQHGFNATSLRAITHSADVNLASVNYHFGSKKELVKAVIARYMDHLSPHLSSALLAISQTVSPSLSQVFNAFVTPLLSLNEFRNNGTRLFLLLLSRGYSESHGFLRWYLTSRYPQVFDCFIKAVNKAAPDLTQEELFWRLHFTMGAVIFTLSSSDALIDIAKNDYQQEITITQILEKVIPYVAAGVAAPLNQQI